MKNFIIFLLLFLVFKSNAYTQEDIKRTVIEENDNIAWKVDDKFIMPECFDYVWSSGDRYETFFDEYIEKLDTSHWKDPRFQNFIVEIGKYLNKEVPLNHSIKDGWEEYPEGISLSRKLDNCMRIKPETKIRLEHKFGRSEVGYEVLETYKIDKGKDLAPYIKIKFETIKKVKITWWDGGSMGRENQSVTYGLLETNGKKILLPLINHIDS